jgi:hypothetical protein
VSLLTRITKGRQARPVRLLVYGPVGCGKSTFAMQAPDAMFIDAEDRTAHLPVWGRFVPKTWPEILEFMGTVIKDNLCKTLVFDTLDYMEGMLWEHLAAKEGVSTIEKVAGGWGKGYNVARDQFNLLMMGVDKLARIGITSILLAHGELKTFKNPTGEDYDQWAIKLHKASKALITSKVDAVGFACWEDYARKAEKDAANKHAKAKAITTGERVLKFAHDPAYETKPGIPLPDDMPLSWAAFEAALNAPNQVS